jgi:hypothetical protein
MNGTNVPSSVGGPKLIGVNLTNNTIFKVIVFSDSYTNEIRSDLRPSVTASGQGIGYITNSSQEGRNGIIIVDLGTGESWRQLDGTSYVHPETGFLPFIWGDSVYSLPNGPTMPISQDTFGADGIALSADGETLYFVLLRCRVSIPLSPPHVFAIRANLASSSLRNPSFRSGKRISRMVWRRIPTVSFTAEL